jgi:excinuclease ABC subunit B
MDFNLQAPFKPTGDQPAAIKALISGLNSNQNAQTLLGATGTGKTFTVANVIQEVNRPTLILSHNKTLAAQLFGEFKQFFPDNLVEYFVSYYDYYQPEAYLPTTGTYIEKDLSINEEIEKLRLRTTSSLLSGRRDIIVVSSVSCIYGIGNPTEFHKSVVKIQRGQAISRNKFLLQLVEGLYARTETEFKRGTFRVKGENIDIFLAYADYAIRVVFWGDEIEAIETIDPETGKRIAELEEINVYPANIFVTSKETLAQSFKEIESDMVDRVDFLRDEGKNLEAKRLEERVRYDLEMMFELGYCSGIENYSRYFDRRSAGDRPFCILDYFPDDFLTVIDESHVTVSQIGAMYGGDRSRKTNLVEYGFRLPSALDNRPLKFDEFDNLIGQTIYVSATPADFELEKSEGVLVDQVIRPTGLLDPVIEIRPIENQVDDLLEEIRLRTAAEERTLVTTLTKRMAEELNEYFLKLGVRCSYIHSDVDTLERIEILRQLRLGFYDVLIGVNLLREGLDLPEVSLVAILDADKEGFLRSARSLTQTVGRAARNVNGKAIMYANKITKSMQRTMDETMRRREKQIAYNTKHNQVPTALVKSIDAIMDQTKIADGTNEATGNKYNAPETEMAFAAESNVQYKNAGQLSELLVQTKKDMQGAAKEMDFVKAALLRDQMFELEKLIQKKR